MLVNEIISTSSRTLQQHLFSQLRTCNSIRKLTQIHAQIIINGFTQKNYILVQLLSFYTTSGYLKHALNVFDNIDNPSTTIWNQIIRGYARSEMPQKPVELYNRMMARNVEPDGFTYSFLLSACAKSGLLKEGKQVHGRVLANGFCSNVFVNTNLVNLYAVGGGDVGDLVSARLLFDEMSERNVVSWNSMLAGYIRAGDIDGARRIFDQMPERNVLSWTTMVSGYARSGKGKLALSLFNEMRRAHVELDQVALLAALSACAELGDLKLGTWIHSYTEKAWQCKNKPVLVSLSNALIHMYASCGLIDEGYKIFKDMPHRTTVSWTSIINGFAKQGRADEALRVFDMMLSSGRSEAKPDEITFIGVLSACNHVGLVNEGRQIFNCMSENFGISPQIEHYGCIVDLLSRAGLLKEAMRLIETMPMKPNNAVWGAFLGGCRIYKNAEFASHVAENLVGEIDPNILAGYFVLLSNLYADNKMWTDVANVREKMVEMTMRKPPGRSWVQINGVIHDFVAGDWTHKNASLIYEMLGEVTRQARLEGYNTDASEVFLDVEA